MRNYGPPLGLWDNARDNQAPTAARDGKVARYRGFLSEQEAFEAVGLSEQDAYADS
jgi:hypothetical protein